MTKIDPIIAVKNVEKSSKWYQSVFDCENTHGGIDFAVLETAEDGVILCLHKWGEHGHSTMTNPKITVGNGLILYFRTSNMNKIYENLKRLNYPIEEKLHLNQNSTKMEFAVRDPDGYFLIIAEFHEYEG